MAEGLRWKGYLVCIGEMGSERINSKEDVA
jgi:hypothetical protein